MRWCANLKPLSHPPGISPDTFSKLYDFQYPKVQLFFYTYKYLELNNVNRHKYFVAIQIIYIFVNIIIKTYKDGQHF